MFNKENQMKQLLALMQKYKLNLIRQSPHKWQLPDQI